MAEEDTCAVCYEEFNKSTRKNIECPKCSTQVCSTCVIEHMTSSYVDPRCSNPECKLGFTYEFLSKYLTKSFLNKDWLKYRQNTLYEREKSLLPGTLAELTAMEEEKKVYEDAVKALKNLIENTPLYCGNDACGKVIAKNINTCNEGAIICRVCKCNTCSKCKRVIHRKVYKRGMAPPVFPQKKCGMYDFPTACVDNVAPPKYKELNERYNELKTIMREYKARKGKLGEKTERKVFIMHCPVTGCRGFLSTKYICVLCDAKVCKDCHAVKKNENKEEHTCNEEEVASVKLKKKENKKCPSCGVPIFRVSGCRQMWCTQCHISFDWKSGKIITKGEFHNPHYYEWMQRNEGVNFRVQGDAPCGGEINNVNIISDEYRKISGREFRLINHMGGIEIPKYSIDEASKFYNLRIKYLKNKIDLDEWKRRMALLERRCRKLMEIRKVIDMYREVSMEYLRQMGSLHVFEDILNKIRDSSDIVDILNILIENAWAYELDTANNIFTDFIIDGFEVNVYLKMFIIDNEEHKIIKPLYEKLTDPNNQTRYEYAYKRYEKIFNNIKELKKYYNETLKVISKRYNNCTVPIVSENYDIVHRKGNNK